MKSRIDSVGVFNGISGKEIGAFGNVKESGLVTKDIIEGLLAVDKA